MRLAHVISDVITGGGGYEGGGGRTGNEMGMWDVSNLGPY